MLKIRINTWNWSQLEKWESIHGRCSKMLGFTGFYINLNGIVICCAQ